MREVQVLLYKDDNGNVPILEWLDKISSKAQDKCAIRIKRLRDCGHELRRPEADYLRDGIYELRDISELIIGYSISFFGTIL